MHAQHQRTQDKIERARKLKAMQEASMYSFKPDLSKGAKKRGKSLKPKETQEVEIETEEAVPTEDLAFTTPIKEEASSIDEASTPATDVVHEDDDAEVAAVPNIIDGQALLAKMLGVTIEHLNKVELEDDFVPVKKDKTSRRTKNKRKQDIDSRLDDFFQQRNNVFIPQELLKDAPQLKSTGFLVPVVSESNVKDVVAKFRAVGESKYVKAKKVEKFEVKKAVFKLSLETEAGQREALKAAIDNIWDTYDADRSGALDFEETKRFVKDTMGSLGGGDVFND